MVQAHEDLLGSHIVWTFTLLIMWSVHIGSRFHRPMFTRVWWRSWKESLKTRRSCKKTMPFGHLQIVLDARQAFIFHFHQYLLCYPVTSILLISKGSVSGAGDCHWRWTHLIHNLKDRFFGRRESEQVSDSFKYFDLIILPSLMINIILILPPLP